jgi:hypothetical protein
VSQGVLERDRVFYFCESMQYFYARFRDWNRIMIQTTLKDECESGTETKT